MDAHIGEIEAVVHDIGPDTSGDAQLDRIARRVIAMLDQRNRRAEYARDDRAINATAIAEKERYG